MSLFQTHATPTSFRRRTRVLALAVLALLVAYGTAYAAEPHNLNDVGAGSLLFSGPDGHVPAPRVATDVQIRVSGLAARVKVSQSFRNEASEWLEGVYVFPLPDTAAVDHLRMRIGERVIVGEIKTRQKARHHYEKAKASGKKASLIEQERANIFTNSVANIGPGETVLVEIEYQQRVDYDDGSFSLRFPMAITPRYLPPVDVGGGTPFDGNDAAAISPPLAASRALPTASIEIALDAGFPLDRVRSAYHAIDESPTARGVDVRLSDGRVVMDRDFELTWRAALGSEPAAAVFSESVGEHRYVQLMFMPPQALGGPLPARELILIIDRSGSMAGTSIVQARAALGQALDRLTPRDRFNVIAFDSDAQALFPMPEVADGLARETARGFVESLEVEGGTNIAAALELALDARHATRALADGYFRQVVFITDGSVGNEEALFALIDKGLGESRLFTVGIGPAPNSYFMRRAAGFGRGTFTHIGSLSEVQEKMTSLLRKLENPALTDIRVDWPAGATVLMTPRTIPDLYAGEPVMLSAKIDGGAERVVIHGGARWRRELWLTGSESAGIGVLFARSRIAELMDERLRGGERGPLEEAITALALEHHLVSKFTSLVAVEATPSAPAGSAPKTAAVPAAAPPAMLASAGYPAGATSARFLILMGGVLLLMPFFLRGGWRQ